MKANTNVEWLRMSIGERASAVIAPTCVLIAATAGVVGGFVWLDKTRNDHALTNVGLPLFVFGINIDLAIQGGRAKTNKAIVQNPPQGMHFSKRGGIEVILIPAGKFRMGDDDDVNGNKRHNVFLDSYVIGKAPVTVGQFKAYCKDAHIDFSKYKSPFWGWIDDHPMVNVRWQEARDFCIWAGGDLPTEAQWEKAARGSDGRKYPWGFKWDGSRLHWSSDGHPTSAKMTASVNAHPNGASPYGCLDMAGNVFQWCLDRWALVPTNSDTRNPKGPSTGKGRLVRGGSWDMTDPVFFQCSFREATSPRDWQDRLGFRFAAIP